MSDYLSDLAASSLSKAKTDAVGRLALGMRMQQAFPDTVDHGQHVVAQDEQRTDPEVSRLFYDPTSVRVK